MILSARGGGWVATPRRWKEYDALTRAQARVLFRIMQLATWKPEELHHEGRRITFPAGTLVCTIRELARHAGVRQTSVHRALRKLVDWGYLRRYPLCHYQAGRREKCNHGPRRRVQVLVVNRYEEKYGRPLKGAK